MLFSWHEIVVPQSDSRYSGLAWMVITFIRLVTAKSAEDINLMISGHHAQDKPSMWTTPWMTLLLSFVSQGLADTFLSAGRKVKSMHFLQESINIHIFTTNIVYGFTELHSISSIGLSKHIKKLLTWHISRITQKASIPSSLQSLSIILDIQTNLERKSDSNFRLSDKYLLNIRTLVQWPKCRVSFSFFCFFSIFLPRSRICVLFAAA